MTTVRGLIEVAVKRGWDMFQIDVNNAFLHGNLNKEVFMEIPHGLMVPESGLVCKLNKSLYGLKQASRQWYAKLTEALCSRGYEHSMHDYSFFYKMNGASLVYVEVCSSLSSPLDPNVKLKAKEGAPLSDRSCYRKLIGKLNFLTNTRLDIAFSVQHLSQFMQDLRELHLKAVYHLLRYLKTDPSLGIFFSKDDDYIVKAYCDFDWASCPDSRKSVTVYIVMLGNSPISWKSKKQETISLSSAEAE
uniref:Uncharacterized mitochondrial protein AtMg00810-like n=1 Tax=Nicotiana tabacum TaxID=4097 RepID=A0A1S3XC87_TOBAC|nr:PREDICTED: uncharacterized mitochondrial protein AtMg00810-like [Nicotiana tabacum]